MATDKTIARTQGAYRAIDQGMDGGAADAREDGSTELTVDRDVAAAHFAEQARRNPFQGQRPSVGSFAPLRRSR